MTRPRSASGTIAWISVFEAAVWAIIAKPAGISKTTENQNDLEREKARRLTPNIPAPQATHRPRPRT